MTSSTLLACGFRAGAAEVRLALGLPPLPPKTPAPVKRTRYVTGENRTKVHREVMDCTPLMVGLALAGWRAQQIAPLMECSASAVKARLQNYGVSHGVGRPGRDAAAGG